MQKQAGVIFGIAVLALSFIVTPKACAQNLEATIEYLLSSVENSPHIFIRNGKEYSGLEAAKHFRRKYNYYRNKIKTSQDFIEFAASHSLFTKKQYFVRMDDGNLIPCANWLEGLLQEKQE